MTGRKMREGEREREKEVFRLTRCRLHVSHCFRTVVHTMATIQVTVGYNGFHGNHL